MDAIGHLERLAGAGAPALGEFLAKWPWLLEPAWTRWRDEPAYSGMLERHAPEDDPGEGGRRIGFAAIGIGSTVNVVELKRPGHVVRSKDIDRLRSCAGLVRESLGTAGGRYDDVAGYLVAGSISADRDTKINVRESRAARRYVVEYGDILGRARRLHGELGDKLGAEPGG